MSIKNIYLADGEKVLYRTKSGALITYCPPNKKAYHCACLSYKTVLRPNGAYAMWSGGTSIYCTEGEPKYRGSLTDPNEARNIAVRGLLEWVKEREKTS